MPNGNGQASGGTFNYWDRQYSGLGSTTTDNAFLSGGLGDLTDGVTTTSNWFAIENVAGTGPYVGWRDQDPKILFRFGAIVPITTISVHFDDSDSTGGVSAPRGVTIDGTFYAVSDPLGATPFWVTFDNLNITADHVTVQFNRNNTWVFADEVSFNPVPEPGTILALAAASGMLLMRRRR